MQAVKISNSNPPEPTITVEISGAACAYINWALASRAAKSLAVAAGLAKRHMGKDLSNHKIKYDALTEYAEMLTGFASLFSQACATIKERNLGGARVNIPLSSRDTIVAALRSTDNTQALTTKVLMSSTRTMSQLVADMESVVELIAQAKPAMGWKH